MLIIASQVTSKMRISQLLLVICALLPMVFSYRILGVYLIPSKSHYYDGQAFMQGFAERSHEVTVISPYQERKRIKNYNEIFIEKYFLQLRLKFFISLFWNSIKLYNLDCWTLVVVVLAFSSIFITFIKCKTEQGKNVLVHSHSKIRKRFSVRKM